MSYSVTGMFRYTTSEMEAEGTVTVLASYVSPDRSTWTATSGTPIQTGNIQCLVSVDLTDAERKANVAVKFTTSRSDLSDLIVRYNTRDPLYNGGSLNEKPVRCSKSKMFFPESRIKQSGGKKYGDKFYIEEPKEWRP